MENKNMKDFDNFYEIGMGFIDNSTNDESNYPENDLLFLQNKQKRKDVKRTTSDGRDGDTFSVIYRPDPNFPVPDTTGNGVATEGLDTDYYNKDQKVNDNAIKAKSELNNLINLYLYIKTLLMDDINKITIENVEITGQLFNNSIKMNYKTTITHSYIKLIGKYSIYDLFKKLIYTLESFDPTRDDNEFIDSYYIDQIYKVMNISLYGTGSLNYNFNDIFGTDFDKFNNIITDLNNIFELINKTNFKVLCDSKVKTIKSNFAKYDNVSGTILKETVDKIYNTTIVFQSFLEYLLMDMIKYLEFITPVQPKIIKFNSRIFLYDNKIDPWISCDYHLLKELLHGGSEESTERSESIIEMHNAVVKPNDDFLFLGDISESEFFDNKKCVNSWIFEKLKSCCKRLNGRKIIIIGNNDTGPDDFYKQCGFTEIHHDPIITNKYIFSHGPVNTISNKLNIHGHIHGNKRYWGIDYHNHIDAYYALWGSPVKLSQLTKKDIQSFYYNGCVTDNKEICKDTELFKKPGNIK